MPTTWMAAAAVGLGLVGVAASRPGQLVQLTGAGACASQLDTGGSCADGRALNAPDAVAVSPDGASVFVAGFGVSVDVTGNEGSVAIFSRRAADGRISQAAGPSGCVSHSDPGCTPGRGLAGASAVTLSPDGRNVYAAGFLSGSVTVFSRSASGRLAQLPGTAGCVNEDGLDGCATGTALLGASDIAISRDGRNAYVAAYGSRTVTVFDRNPATGALSPRSGPGDCVEGVGTEEGEDTAAATQGCTPVAGVGHPFRIVISPDGLNVYVLADDAVAVLGRTSSGTLTQPSGPARCFSEDGSDGDCTPLPLLDGSIGIAVSPDGLNVYVASLFAGAIVTFRRSLATGGLTRLTGGAGCVSEAGPADGCALGVGLDGVSNVAVTPDGANVYAVSPYRDAVLAFSRGKGGALTQLPGLAACVSDGGGGGCTRGDVLTRASALAISPDSRNVYVTSAEPIGDAAATGQELGSLTVFARQALPTVTLGTPTAALLRAGKPFAVSVRVQTNAGGPEVACTARTGTSALSVRARYAKGAVTCTGVLPATAAGKRLTGTVTATTAGAKATQRFSFPVGR